jgi:hippurate hydrolase
MLRVGTVEPVAFEASEKSGAAPVSLHSPFFAPDRERTLKAAVTAEVLSLRELMPVRAGPAPPSR